MVHRSGIVPFSIKPTHQQSLISAYYLLSAMWFPNTAALLLLAIAQASPSSAKQSSSLESISITKRFHNAALRHSAGLARDLRTAWGGVLVTRAQQPKSKRSLQKRNIYCVSQKNGGQVPFSAGNRTSSAHPGPTGTSGSGGHSSSSTATSTGSGATPSSTSSWKLVESHVSRRPNLTMCVCLIFMGVFSKEATFSMVGLSPLEMTPPTAPSNSSTRERG